MSNENSFQKKFLKDDTVSTTPVYEIYASAARRLWDQYYSTYDLRPRSIAKVSDGTNRSVNFYKDNKHILEIAIGKTTTLYVLDDYLRSKIRIDYNQDPSGRYRHTFNTFEECFDVINSVLENDVKDKTIERISITRSKLFVASDMNNDMLAQVKVLRDEYSQIEISNIDQTGVKQWRAAYFYDKNVQRRNNQLIEVWYEKRNDRVVFVIAKSLMTSDEIIESDKNKRATVNRGRLYRYNLSHEDLLSFIREKLDLYCKGDSNSISKLSNIEEISGGLYNIQLSKAGLDIKDNWKGDPRDRFIKLFAPLTDGSEYYFKRNTTDSSGKLLELYRNGESKRVMLFKGKQDMTIGVAFNGDFYNYIKQTVDLPENQKSYRTQPHMDLSLTKLWNVVCAATSKRQYIVNADELPVKVESERATVIKPVKEQESPLVKYSFVKMIDTEKRVAVVKSSKDGKNYVRKEYDQYNLNIFERLKKADIKGIPHIYECIKDNGVLVTIEEFISGRNIDEVIEQEGVFDEEEMLHIALKLCDILEELHKLDPPMIHRDIKPSNIMLKKTGEVVLIDFNASREFKEGYSQDTVLLGTKNFASPEQLMGFGDSDARTDIFGFGATMSYIMTKMPINQMVAPGRYSQVFTKCTRMDKKDRYQSVSELREALLNT